ncbi:hypothetical protein [Mycobacterium sp. DL592]|nr:hypothetical protein [Mycobacterium sp. DL592]
MKPNTIITQQAALDTYRGPDISSTWIAPIEQLITVYRPAGELVNA